MKMKVEISSSKVNIPFLLTSPLITQRNKKHGQGGQCFPSFFFLIYNFIFKAAMSLSAWLSFYLCFLNQVIYQCRDI